MKFISESIAALFFGGFLGLLFWATSEGVAISGVPAPLIAASLGVFAWAFLVSVWWGKGPDILARTAGACFTAVVVGFPIFGAFIGDNTRPGELIDPYALLSLMKWVMVTGLVTTIILSLASIYISLKQSHIASDS